ncbi:type II toxin-antitoxin system RelE/ParE family toxin [Parasphingorhabdus sp.]|uniref:type II toxin-antitoxin system RelE/ParE family toxin n=1 Tax=Parasphingorhabdus sp. TaxID=2709688 RepID=UPI003D267B3A
MKPIKFRAKAERDLLAIISYFSDYSSQSVQNILDDIYRSIDQLTFFPNLGQPIEGQNYRRLVTLKYHFVICYEVTVESVNIVGIFRFQDRDV